MKMEQDMILNRGRDITSDVAAISSNEQTGKYDVTFRGGKTYGYSRHSLEWITGPEIVSPTRVQILHDGVKLRHMTAIYIFHGRQESYWRIRFDDGQTDCFAQGSLQVTWSCLSEREARDCFYYLKEIAATHALRTENGDSLLEKQYEGLEFVGENTALAVYLNPSKYSIRTYPAGAPIFPFGGNASQCRAVQRALTNQISVIEGPPGTGKTQTILNITANLLLQGKTVLIVSNNNSAINNVFEKLSAAQYGMGFLVAPLGSAENKARFIHGQAGYYPDLRDWEREPDARQALFTAIEQDSEALMELFEKQERLAHAKGEREALELEMQYFEQFCAEIGYLGPSRAKQSLDSQTLMDLWQACSRYTDRGRKPSLWFCFKNALFYKTANWDFFRNHSDQAITLLQSLFYHARQGELSKEIAALGQTLQNNDAHARLKRLTASSMEYLRSQLYEKYGGRETRPIFSETDLWKVPDMVAWEYPIVLSTTFSSRASLGKFMTYDYLIMDEASQVDVATGALALSCVKNAVIVGDAKQLPNVVTREMRDVTNAVLRSYQIDPGYAYADNSFLKSICSVLPDAPQTMLREHYRCHPKIIGFCNQRFYQNQLVIMTEDRGEPDALSVYQTVAGDHHRGRLNQRQIDVICREALPALADGGQGDIGIIAPYNQQVEAIREQVKGAADVATVHKFQGREKNTIIFTATDDRVTDFSDDPYLLNVAISRARKRLCLVVSGNEQPAGSIMGELIDYIKYNNFMVAHSEIYSVFDYLYQQYTDSRRAYLRSRKRVSKYDSENLMHSLIEEILKKPEFCRFSVALHMPLHMLIRNTCLLNQEECRFVRHPSTHVDFLIYSAVSKKPVLAVEVDGYNYHARNVRQTARDRMKDRILQQYGIPILRLPTNGSGEKEKITAMLLAD